MMQKVALCPIIMRRSREAEEKPEKQSNLAPLGLLPALTIGPSPRGKSAQLDCGESMYHT